jgi:hypothetical protein
MKSPLTLLVVLGSLGLAACVESGPSETVAVTGGDLTGPTATNCRAAIARQTNLSVGDVAIFDVLESEAGNQARATVAGADAPWVCRTDRNANVLQVMFEGQG